MKGFEVEAYIKISCWQDIADRESFVQDIDPKAEKPVEILAGYDFGKEEVSCGLKDCHQPHGKGFLVKTTLGRESNIGGDCGKRIFGADFQSLRNRFHQAERVRHRRERLNEFLARKDEYRAKLDALKDRKHGAEWLQRSVKHFREKYPPRLAAELDKRARRNDAVLTEERRRSDEEIENLVAATEGMTYAAARFESKAVGRLEGLAVFQSDVRELVVNRIQTFLDALDHLDTATASEMLVTKLYERSEAIERTFEEIESLLVEGQRFFAEDNLKQLKLLRLDDETRIAMQDVRWDFDKGDARVKTQRKSFLPW